MVTDFAAAIDCSFLEESKAGRAPGDSSESAGPCRRVQRYRPVDVGCFLAHHPVVRGTSIFSRLKVLPVIDLNIDRPIFLRWAFN
jgi:hypothetical protein